MKKLTKTDMVWAGTFLLLLAMLIYKCPYGFADVDETFYLTIPYRLAQGDSLIQHEWNLSQLAFVLLYPFFKAYLFLGGQMEGIVLSFRYLYVAVHSLTAVYLYLRLRRESSWGAAFASLFYLLFSHGGIMALSYYSMGLGLMTIAVVTLYCDRRGDPKQQLLAGLSFAGAVLCCPFLVLGYVLYGAWCLGKAASQKDTRILAGMKGFWFFTAGCVLAAAAFFAFVLSRCSVMDILRSVSYILNDPEHTNLEFGTVLVGFVNNLFFPAKVAEPIYACGAALLAVMLLDKKRQQRQGWYLLVAVLLGIWHMVVYIRINRFVNFLAVPLGLTGFFCGILGGKACRREMACFWIPGLVYSFCLNWGSNQGFLVICFGAYLCTLGCAMMLPRLMKELGGWKGEILTAGIFAVVLTALGFVRYSTMFWENDGMIWDMTAQISVGAEKGIWTTPAKKEAYETLHESTREVRDYPGQKVLYYTDALWLYLDDPKENASYSSWISEPGWAASEKLVAYYELNQEKIPDIVYTTSEALEASIGLKNYLLELGFSGETRGEACILTRE